MHKAASPIGLAKRVALQMESPENAKAFLSWVISKLWPEVDFYVTKVLKPSLMTVAPPDLDRVLRMGLKNHMDILDFSEAFLREMRLSNMAEKVSRIMQNEIEIEDARTASLQGWGPTLKEAASKTAKGPAFNDMVYMIKDVYEDGLHRVEQMAGKKFQVILNKIERALKKFGVTIDRRRSYVGFHMHGSDGMRLEGQITFNTDNYTGYVSLQDLFRDEFDTHVGLRNNVWDFGEY